MDCLLFLVINTMQSTEVAMASDSQQKEEDETTRLRKENDELRHQLHQQHSKLEHSHEQSRLALAIKTEFLATMSHELRTPLNSVLGMAELLESTSLSSEQSQCVGMIRDSGKLLLILINDMLDWSKVDSGKLELRPQSVSVLQLVESVIIMCNTSAVVKGLDLHYWIDPNLPLTLVLDTTRMQQIMLNLLSNAIKFTTQGDVFLLFQASSLMDKTTSATQMWRLDVEVHDTGIGISSTDMSHLFDPFYQGQGSSVESSGTGFGLPITRRIVEAMQGEIHCSSNPGQGSVFRVTGLHATLHRPDSMSQTNTLSCNGEFRMQSVRSVRDELLAAVGTDLNLIDSTRIVIVCRRNGSAKMWKELLQMCKADVKIVESLKELGCATLVEGIDLLLVDGDDNQVELTPLTEDEGVLMSTSTGPITSFFRMTIDGTLEAKLARICRGIIVLVTEPIRQRANHVRSGSIMPPRGACSQLPEIVSQIAVESADFITSEHLQVSLKNCSVAPRRGYNQNPSGQCPNSLFIGKLVKPFRHTQFLAMIGQHLAYLHDMAFPVLSSPVTASALTPTPCVWSLQPPSSDRRVQVMSDRRILVVDDNLNNRKLMCYFLRKLGFLEDRIAAAASGDACLELVRRALNNSSSQQTYPEVFLMDISMSPMDGITCTRHLRDIFRHQVSSSLSSSSTSFSDERRFMQPYIIAQTANTTQDVRDACFACGMNAFLSKPLSLQDLKNALLAAHNFLSSVH